MKIHGEDIMGLEWISLEPHLDWSSHFRSTSLAGYVGMTYNRYNIAKARTWHAKFSSRRVKR